jgi:hypothetical protein
MFNRSDWFTFELYGGKLGETFAWMRVQSQEGSWWAATGVPGAAALLDLQAIQSLSRVRIQQREALVLYLKELQMKTSRIAAITDFFSHSSRKNFPKEVISLISDYELPISAAP